MISLTEAITRIRQQENDINTKRLLIAGNYPGVVKALRIIDLESSKPGRRKGFNLIKRENKKHGYLYYVRYSDNGKMLPTAWNTHTNNLGEAERFAKENKTDLVERYKNKHDERMYSMLEEFYSKSDLTKAYLTDQCRKEYNAVILNKFIPFLKDKKITTFEQINTNTLRYYQDSLQASGIKPQTVNNKLKPVKRILDYFFRRGVIRENPAANLRGIPVHEKDKEARGCYEIERLKGAFQKRWHDKTSQLLVMLIYTTGMRNSEIQKIRMKDITKIAGCRFIEIKESKTSNGIRLVPLHDFVYKKMRTWAAKNKKNENDFLFNFSRAEYFTKANSDLAEVLRSAEEMESENITFYSGRHFWKTLMNAEGLGEDIEEIFMGHKVSSSVAKLYNHKNKQGKKHMIRKAKQVLSILNRCIFPKKP